MRSNPARIMPASDDIARSVSHTELQLTELRALRDRHPLWRNRLFVLFENGTLNRRDLQYVFSQYQLYSRNFTRFLSALMANCESDLFRAQLSQNLWEEGGGCKPELRHAELFRRFLRDSLDVPAPEDTVFEPYTQQFVREYQAFCLGNHASATSAFLSLGTEGIVPRMYRIFMTGLRRAGLAEDELAFFQLHVECDDDHAATLEQMMLSYAGDARWFETCRRAMLCALDLRTTFFEHCAGALERRRLDGLVTRINAETSLCPRAPEQDELCHRSTGDAPPLYTSSIPAEGIEFAVTRIPLASEVLDPRRVEIPVGKCNERHRHAHETFIYILEGSARVEIDGHTVEVRAGDSVMVPRWAVHQTRNIGDAVLRFIAVTDYHLTRSAYLGDAGAYRRDEATNQHRRER
jgi:pyrroloquinoline quinone (PQQ) biosynthesis protein C/mannose-6-phosphate isomerase-like protein (cupin superfamily)